MIVTLNLPELRNYNNFRFGDQAVRISKELSCVIYARKIICVLCKKIR